MGFSATDIKELNTTTTKQGNQDSDFGTKVKNALKFMGNLPKGVPEGLGKTGSFVMGAPEGAVNLGAKAINLGAKGLDKIGLFPKTNFQGQPINIPKKVDRINVPYFPSYEEAEAMRMKDPFFGQEPKTKGAEYGSKIAEFGSSGGIFGRLPAYIGMAGGGIDQAVTDFSGSSKAGIVANIASQILIGLGTRNPKALNLARESYNDLKNSGKLKEAKEIEKIAKDKYGIDLTITESAQAVGSQSLDNLYNIGANTTKGKGIFGGLFNKRGDQISASQTKFLEEFFGDANLIPKNVTGKYVETINNAINNTRTRIGNIARKKGYAQFDEIKDFDDTINIVVKEIETLSKLPKNVSMKSVYTDLAKKIKGGNQQNLQKVSDELGDKIANAKFGKDKDLTLARELTIQKTILDGALDSFEGYKKASSFYSKASEKILKPLEEAITSGGQTSTKANADLNLIRKVLTDENVSPVEIKRLAKNLNKYDPDLFREMASLLMERTLGSVSKLKGNTYGKGLKAKVFKDENIKKNWEAIIEALAISEGKNPIKAVKGFNQYFNILEGTSLPALGSQTNKLKQVEETLKPSTSIDLEIVPLVQRVSQFVTDKRYGDIANALSVGVDDFIALATTTSRRTKELIADGILNLPTKAEREFNQ